MKKQKFKPRAGQIDFTNARFAPVINCVVKYRGKILLLQRSKELNFYPGYWNGVSGFLDDKRSLEQKIKDEVSEETGIPKKMVKKVWLGEIFHHDAPKYKKTWIVHPAVVEVKTDKIQLDWESQNYKWIKPSQAKQYKLMPGFGKVLEKLSDWL